MKIAIVVVSDALSSTITGPADVLLTAAMLGGLNWQLHCVSEDSEPVTCFNGIALSANCGLSDSECYDLVLIPSLVISQQGLLRDYQPLVNWLNSQSEAGAKVASICTGAFLLAETGLLDGKAVTTHWAFADVFRERYPRVLLDEKQTLIDSGSVMCCSAGTAWQDLVLYLLHEYVDDAVILQLSETFQLQRHNTGQQAFCGLPVPLQSDPAIEQAKQALKQQMTEAAALDSALAASGLSARTFQRRFKSVTGMTAGRYLQLLRVEKAKQLLIFERSSLEQISYSVGYEDPSYLRRLFRKETGLSMREYRSRFAAL